MSRKGKWLLGALMLGLQFALFRHARQVWVLFDLFFLLLCYGALRLTPAKAILLGTLLGWLTDPFVGGVMGVFGFSRALGAYMVSAGSRYMDLKNPLFVFLLVSVSLLLSNAVGLFFLHLISGHPLSPTLLVYQPLLSGALGVVMLKMPYIKSLFKTDVY